MIFMLPNMVCDQSSTNSPKRKRATPEPSTVSASRSDVDAVELVNLETSGKSSSPRSTIASQFEGLRIIGPMRPPDFGVKAKTRKRAKREERAESAERWDSARRVGIGGFANAVPAVTELAHRKKHDGNMPPKLEQRQAQETAASQCRRDTGDAAKETSAPSSPRETSPKPSSEICSPPAPSDPPPDLEAEFLTSLTWKDGEITGHLCTPETDPEDDGYGINGIGFKPTPALAYARSQRRRQQVLEWRAREARDARQRRSQRRLRSGSAVDSDAERNPPTLSGDVVKRTVRFA